jgi:hypothetical protein
MNQIFLVPQINGTMNQILSLERRSLKHKKELGTNTFLKKELIKRAKSHTISIKTIRI